MKIGFMYVRLSQEKGIRAFHETAQTNGLMALTKGLKTTTKNVRYHEKNNYVLYP